MVYKTKSIFLDILMNVWLLGQQGLEKDYIVKPKLKKTINSRNHNISSWNIFHSKHVVFWGWIISVYKPTTLWVEFSMIDRFICIYKSNVYFMHGIHINVFFNVDMISELKRECTSMEVLFWMLGWIFSVYEQKTLCVQFSILHRGYLKTLRRYWCMVYNEKEYMHVHFYVHMISQLKNERMTKNCLKVIVRFLNFTVSKWKLSGLSRTVCLFKISPWPFT